MFDSQRATLGFTLGAITLCFILSVTSCQPNTPESINRLLIRTNEEGVYAIQRIDLEKLGFNFDSFTHAHLSLQHGQAQVPFQIEGDALYFYAAEANGRYSTQRAFWLKGNEAGTQTGLIPPAAGQPTLIHHLEKNNLYESRAAHQVSQPWFWQQIPHGQSQTLQFEYPHYPLGAQTLRITLWGLTYHDDISEDHTAELYINGKHLTSLTWDGQAAHQVAVKVPEGWLNTGSNKLTFDNGQTDVIDVFYVDALQIEGQANPSADAPFTISGAFNLDLSRWETRPFIFPIHQNPDHYFVAPQTAVLTPVLSKPTVWEPPPANSNFVIILGDVQWEATISPLVKARQADGLYPHAVTMRAVAERYGSGLPEPDAIRAFLSDLQSAQPTGQPLFVLLVGDAVIDLYQTPNHQNLIPSYIIPVTFGGETVSDSQLGDIDVDGQADVAIGRWPVSTASEVRQLVEKMLRAETAVYAPQTRTILDPSEPTFTAVSQRLNLTTTSTSSSQTPRLTTYIGHGSLTQWGTQNLQFALDRQAHSPILLQFTCLTGLFAHALPSLSESLLLAQNGPSHIVSATSLTLSAHQEPFAQALLNESDVGKNGRIGTAFLNAQQSLQLSQPGQQEIHDTFLLFGDPTSKIHNQINSEK